MAFLCPSRVGRKKKKKAQEVTLLGGRITGSASVDTLIRVGLEKQHGLSEKSRMVVTSDFSPCVDDELLVQRGQSVYLLYQENDWAYVIGEEGKEGFVPLSFLSYPQESFASPPGSVKKKTSASLETKSQKSDLSLRSIQVETLLDSESFETDLELSESPKASTVRTDEVFETSIPVLFPKKDQGEYIVLYDFEALDENDIGVIQAEIVHVLNADDPDWSWVQKGDDNEGFVPRKFLCSVHQIRNHESLRVASRNSQNPQATSLTQTSMKSNLSTSILSPSLSTLAPSTLSSSQATQILSDSTFTTVTSEPDITELISRYDYTAQSRDDLSVSCGDILYVDMNEQNNPDWLWVYSPRSRKYGYVPRSYLKTPMKTTL